MELAELAAAIERFGPVAFLLTTAADGRPHAVSFELRWQDGCLRGGGGKRSRGNAQERPRVSLLWPAPDSGGYHLIVDGDADVEGTEVVVRPTWAVLHRSIGMDAAPAEDGACVQDCLPLTPRPGPAA